MEEGPSIVIKELSWEAGFGWIFLNFFSIASEFLNNNCVVYQKNITKLFKIGKKANYNMWKIALEVCFK